MSDQPWKEIFGTIRFKRRRRDLYRHANNRWLFRYYRHILRGTQALIAKELADMIVEHLKQKTQPEKA